MGANEYIKLRRACDCIYELLESDIKIWNETSNEISLKYFKAADIEVVGKQLSEIRRLLDIKIHNYRQLERV